MSAETKHILFMWLQQQVPSKKKSKISNHRFENCIESILSQPKGKFSDQSIICRWGQSLTFSDKPSKITSIILDRKYQNNILKINSGIFKFVHTSKGPNVCPVHLVYGLLTFCPYFNFATKKYFSCTSSWPSIEITHLFSQNILMKNKSCLRCCSS